MTTLKVAGLDKPIVNSSIVWIEGDGNYARLHFTDSHSYLASQTLKGFEAKLPAFVRVHKSVLINPKHIVRFEQTKAKQAWIVMSTGQHIEIAHRRINQVRHTLGMASFSAQSFPVES